MSLPNRVRSSKMPSPQRLGIRFAQIVSVYLQMLEVVEDFIPHLDIKSIKKIYDRTTTCIR